MKKYVYFFVAGLTSLVSTQLPACFNQFGVDYRYDQYSAGFSPGHDLGYVDDNCCTSKPEIYFELNTGYSKSDAFLSFESARQTGVAPGITLIRANDAYDWRNLDTYTIGAKSRMLSNWYYGRIQGHYGEICEGENSYDFSQTILGSPTPISALTTSVEGKKRTHGYTYDIAVGLGYPFRFLCDSLVIAPVIGYTYYEMKLKDKVSEANISQSLTVPPSLVLSRATGGHNRTKYRWSSGWLGFDVAYNIGCAWKLFGNCELHYGRLSGYHNGDIDIVQTNSTAIPLANSFTHNTSFHAKNAWGVNLSLSVLYKFMCGWLADWSVGVTGNYFHTSSDHGPVSKDSLKVQTFPLPGTLPLALSSSARLSKIEINTYGVTVNFARTF